MKWINVLAQGFYGNRTTTEVCLDKLNGFLFGYLDGRDVEEERTRRKIINIPGSECVLVYSEEAEARSGGNPTYDDGNTVLHCLCFACRVGKDGELTDIRTDDIDGLLKYFPA